MEARPARKGGIINESQDSSCTRTINPPPKGQDRTINMVDTVEIVIVDKEHYSMAPFDKRVMSFFLARLRKAVSEIKAAGYKS